MSLTLAPPRRVPAPPAGPPPDPEAAPFDPPPMTREEYLAFDNAGTGGFKYEWIDGKVRRMVGGTFNHGIVMSNLAGTLDEALREARRPGLPKMRGCGTDLRTRVPGGPYYYPDAQVVPVPPQFEEPDDQPGLTLLNPVSVAEVLSPSTARVDRGEKRREYLRIPTVGTYLIVQPNVREVLRLTRNGRRWSEKAFRNTDIDLPKLGITLPADRVWEDILPGDRIR